MTINEAFQAVGLAADRTTDMRARNTFYDIYGVMSRASAPQVAKWADKIFQVIDYVNAGHYAGTYDLARQMLNKRSYAN